jgi:nitroreductase
MPQPPIPAQPAENAAATAARLCPQTLALLASRRSTKIAQLAAPGPVGAELDALIGLAARVPDHGKLGPWRFLVLEGETRAAAGRAVAEAMAGDLLGDEARRAAEEARFMRAPAVIVVISTAAPHAKIPEWEQILSAGALCYNLLLVAHAAGWAGCWLSEPPAYDPRARAALGLVEHERIAGFVYLGTAQETAIERVRPAVAARIARFQVPA